MSFSSQIIVFSFYFPSSSHARTHHLCEFPEKETFIYFVSFGYDKQFFPVLSFPYFTQELIAQYL